MSKVLVVEDDRNLSLDIQQWLTAENYSVETVGDGQSALDLLKAYSYDAVILDWELPKLTGIEVLRALRQSDIVTPVLMLTGKAEIDNKETGLDTGADDYLTKPFQFRELSARLRSVLRRSVGLTENVLKAGELTLEPTIKRVTSKGEEIFLLPKEFSLLEFFMRHPNQYFNGEALLSRVWTSDSEATLNSVKTYIYMLRKKLSAAGHDSLIQTAHGLGYRLVSSDKKNQAPSE